MTDHLEQAAAKAAEFAEEITNFRPELIAAHLMYMAGLLRGSAVTLPGPCDSRIPSLVPGVGARWCQLRAGHAGLHEHPDGGSWIYDDEETQEATQ